MTYDEAGGQAGWAAMTPERMAEIESHYVQVPPHTKMEHQVMMGCHARYDVPALLAEVKRLTLARDEFRNAAGRLSKRLAATLDVCKAFADFRLSFDPRDIQNGAYRDELRNLQKCCRYVWTSTTGLKSKENANG